MFGLFKKKKKTSAESTLPGVKAKSPELDVGMEVELEFIRGSGMTVGFSTVLELDLKHVQLSLPRGVYRDPVFDLGEVVLVSFFDGNILAWFEASITERGTNHFMITRVREYNLEPMDFAYPVKGVEINLPIQFRAINVSHLQTAQTKAINPDTFELVTNLPIPIGTVLHMEIQVPDSPILEFQGTVKSSTTLPADTRKSTTVVELINETPDVVRRLFNFIAFYIVRDRRKMELEYM
ncbi:MAG: hypothetical protein J7M18_03905 [Candidatus Eremiobacteraeota bacterium]|nr:hypothetical protein [Candidatus Eremiobacteraeota bacterium]